MWTEPRLHIPDRWSIIITFMIIITYFINQNHSSLFGMFITSGQLKMWLNILRKCEFQHTDRTSNQKVLLHIWSADDKYIKNSFLSSNLYFGICSSNTYLSFSDFCMSSTKAITQVRYQTWSPRHQTFWWPMIFHQHSSPSFL